MTDTNIKDISAENKQRVMECIGEALRDLENATGYGYPSDGKMHALRGLCHIIGFYEGRVPHDLIKEIEEVARKLDKFRDELLKEIHS